MGLAGRKVKQRIPNDPRNLAWANDANKFGAAYLAKLGWNPSQGLGVSGEGRTTAISVTQKLDFLGIGADHRNSEGGIAWKQNKDFENLLKRLNAANGNPQEQDEIMKVEGFTRAGPSAGAETVKADDDVVKEEENVDKKEKKKRKKGEDEEDGERKKKRKKSKSSDEQSDVDEPKKKDKKDKKKKKRESSEEPAPVSATKTEEASPAPAAAPAAPVPSKAPRLHRARHMRAKHLASKSASAIAEILGIAPSTPTPASGSATPSLPTGASSTPYPSTPYEPGPSTSASSSSGAQTPAGDQLKLQELTVSSKSVMDYFKEKLAAKSNSRAGSGTSSPRPEAAGEDAEMDDYAERPRMGLGAPRLRVEVTREEKDEEEVTEVKRGLGGIGSSAGGGMRSQFAAMFAKASTTVTTTIEVEKTEAMPAPSTEAVTDDASKGEVTKKSKDKKDKKKKDKKGKAKQAEAEAETEEVVASEAAEDADEKAERKKRKEEKRKRKEAEAPATAAKEEVDPASDSERKEGKRKKDQRKSKADR
ncbi:hypothetical protein ACG7TL_001570 [Trametes sanguinea]